MSEELIEHNILIAEKSIEGLVEQSRQAWLESRNIIIPPDYKNIHNVIVCGMGGSNWPIHMLKSAFESTKPITVCESYSLPSWADDNTLVILSSYSGDTEETLSCAKDAKAKNCKIIGITSGGMLKEFLTEENYPHYCFNPIHNPSKQPRYGVGYGIFGLLGLFAKLGIVYGLTEQDLDSQLTSSLEYLLANQARIKVSAEDFIKKVKGHIVVVFAAEHLKGNARAFTNQLNETAKNFSFYVLLPELDHNFVEGYREYQSKIVSVFLESPSYLPRIQERFQITSELITDKGYDTYCYKVNKGVYMQEMLEAFLFSSYFSLKLALENNVDPLAIPTIDILKSRMSLTTK